jgi:hypothetical protein
MQLAPGQIVRAPALTQTPDEYVPVLTALTTSPVLGSDGEAEGWFTRIGKFVIGGARFTFFGTDIDAGEGSYRITLPLPVDTSLIDASGAFTSAGHAIGSGRVRTATGSGAPSRVLVLQPTSSTQVFMTQSGTNASVSHSQPGDNWVGNGARISTHFMYVTV